MTTADLLTRILETLREVQARCPELRFEQLIAIIGELAHDETGHSLWDVEDADFSAALERFANDTARREPNRAGPTVAPGHGGIPASSGHLPGHAFKNAT